MICLPDRRVKSILITVHRDPRFPDLSLRLSIMQKEPEIATFAMSTLLGADIMHLTEAKLSEVDCNCISGRRTSKSD